jgi:hypothetical protein
MWNNVAKDAKRRGVKDWPKLWHSSSFLTVRRVANCTVRSSADITLHNATPFLIADGESVRCPNPTLWSAIYSSEVSGASELDVASVRTSSGRRHGMGHIGAG